MSATGYIDGRYCPLDELSLPVTDVGFRLCDMIYDAVHVHGGNFFRLEDHLERFERSITRRRYENFAYTRDEVREILRECVARSDLNDAMVMMIVTRGSPVAEMDLRTCRNRFIAWAEPYHNIVSDEELENGAAVIISNMVVRVPPESIDPTVKNFARLDFVDSLLEAYDRGCRYALVKDGDGNITEGRGYNVFALFGGELVSPDSGVLEGITRRTVVELCERTNVKASLGTIAAEDITRADEVFMASTAGGLMPVVRIDDVEIGGGAPGPVTRRLSDLYWELHRDPAYTTPVCAT